MREAERIAGQLWRSLQGEAWHGPALLRQHNLYHAGQIVLLKRAMRGQSNAI